MRPHPTGAAYVAAALLSTLLACSGTDAGSGGDAGAWRATVDTVGDTVVVRTTSGSVWGDTATLEPEVTVGLFEGADEYMFGDVSAIAVTRAGEVYVLDRQAPVLRKYSPDGTHLADVGRKGGGPGEYERPEALAILPDGRVLVRDPGNARINVYASDDASLTSWRLPGGGSFNTSRPLEIDTAGNAYTLVLLEAGADVTEWTYGLATFTSVGTHTDTLRAPTWDFERRVVTARREGSSSSSRVPFSPGPHWTFSPLGYAVGGLSAEYRIDLFRRDDLVLRIDKEWEPVAVLPEERAEQERRIVENFKEDYGSWKWNGPPIPETKPPFRDLTVDEEGRLWVQLSQPAYEFRTEAEAREEEERSGRPQLRYREPNVFDVFDAGGRYLGAVRAPNDVRTSPEPVMRGDTVWAVTRDELDVERVVRFRLVH